jgi:hypothetical protein
VAGEPGDGALCVQADVTGEAGVQAASDGAIAGRAPQRRADPAGPRASLHPGEQVVLTRSAQLIEWVRFFE